MSNNDSSTPKWIRRHKWTATDGTEHEQARVNEYGLSVDNLEELGQEALRVAAEWRKEIAERVPTPPTYKVFALRDCHGGSSSNIATWIEQPWALMRFGNGTAVAYLVKRSGDHSYQAWIVSAVNSERQWKRRFESTNTVGQHDLLEVFPYTLPDSPSLGDLEQARRKSKLT